MKQQNNTSIPAYTKLLPGNFKNEQFAELSAMQGNIFLTIKAFQEFCRKITLLIQMHKQQQRTI